VVGMKVVVAGMRVSSKLSEVNTSMILELVVGISKALVVIKVLGNSVVVSCAFTKGSASAITRKAPKIMIVIKL